MKTYYEHGGITIYHGDCLNILPQLPIVDLVVSDVSYSVISGGSGNVGDGSPSGILSGNDGKIFEFNNIKTADYARLFYDGLKDPSHCYIFMNFLNLESALADFRTAGFGQHNMYIWPKGNFLPNRWGMKGYEIILFFRKGKAFPLNDTSTKNIEVEVLTGYPNPKSPKLHECEKNLGLMLRLIADSSKPSDTVLDPFCGSGATLAAARLSGRKAIGIDLDIKHCETAAQQLRWVEAKLEMGFSVDEILASSAAGEKREPGIMQGKLL